MNDAQSVISDSEGKMDKTVEHLSSEFSKIRTGRANVSLVSGIRVTYYGNPTPLTQLANVALADARTIVIRPWDTSVIKDIERAILASDLGINPNNDGKMIRLVVPPLSGERRKALVAQIKDMSEKAKVAVRNIRRDTIKALEDLKKNGLVTEDALDKLKKDVQDLTARYEKKIGDVQSSKTEEIMEV
ncbi:MAG: ribosome recycling factor [Planctomycetota bacterium]